MIIVGIPYYEIDSGKKEVLNRCVSSLKGYDKLIVVGKQDTLAKAINMILDLGFSMGADNVIISSDDVILDKGRLDLLCSTDSVVSPSVSGGYNKMFHGYMYSIPRKVYESIGRFDESAPGHFYMDSDYWVRLMEANIPVLKTNLVHITHPEEGRTLSQLKEPGSTREWFIKKHGEKYLGMVESGEYVSV